MSITLVRAKELKNFKLIDNFSSHEVYKLFNFCGTFEYLLCVIGSEKKLYATCVWYGNNLIEQSLLVFDKVTVLFVTHYKHLDSSDIVG